LSPCGTNSCFPKLKLWWRLSKLPHTFLNTWESLGHIFIWQWMNLHLFLKSHAKNSAMETIDLHLKLPLDNGDRLRGPVVDIEEPLDDPHNFSTLSYANCIAQMSIKGIYSHTMKFCTFWEINQKRRRSWVRVEIWRNIVTIWTIEIQIQGI